MLFKEENKVLIKHYRLKKKYGRKKLLKEFPEKNCSKTGLRKLLNEINDTADTKRKQSSGRPQTSQSYANTDTVENLILSDPSNHLSIRKTEMEMEIRKTSVNLIPKFDIGLTPFKLTNIQQLTSEDKNKRIGRGKRLLHSITLASLEKTFFTHEKIFKLQVPNNKQNHRIYGVNLSDIREKRHLEKHEFPISIIISAGVSKLGKTSIHFVTPGSKINSACCCRGVFTPYHDRLLSEQSTCLESAFGGH